MFGVGGTKKQVRSSDENMLMTGENPPAARLKGVGDSLWVSLNPALPADQIQKELHAIFSRLNHLADNTRVVLDPGGEGDHEQLVETLGTYLKATFNVGTVSAAEKKKPRVRERTRSRELHSGWRHRRSNVLMVTGRVRSGQKVEAGKHLVLLGDVNPGGQVTAGGDIFIMGSLRGTATAGSPDDESSIILALDFRPSQIQIGGFVAAGPSAEPGTETEFARVENGEIVVEPYLKANPFGKIPWPEIR
jgi:septum site-determining protein MinC